MTRIAHFEGQLALLASVVMILLSEGLLLQQEFLSGIMLYSLILLLLLLYAAFRWEGDQRYLLALTIPSIIRILDFTLPLGGLPTLFAQMVIAIPLALTSAVFFWLYREEKFAVSFQWRQLHRYLMLIILGSGAGLLLFLLQEPSRFVWNSPLILFFYSVVVIFGMAVLEEWLFRGIMQTALSKLLGATPGGLLVAMVYTIMHLNQGPWTFVLAVFLFALGLGWLQSKTGNLLNVFLVHGAANLFFYLILPWR